MKNLFRRTVSLLLLVAYVAVATPVSELFKLPVLLEHFQEHYAADPETSILSFFLLHYFNGNVRDADYARDMQLPFKTMELPSFSFAATHFAPEPALDTVPAAVPSARKQTLPPVVARLSSAFLATPSQPPEA